MEQKLKLHIIELLKGTGTRMSFDEAVKGLSIESINKVFPNGEYSSWHLLEHMRMLQSDVLDFIVNPAYSAAKYSGKYWPDFSKLASESDWSDTVEGFKGDLNKLIELASDPKTDLFKTIEWGSGQTILRELFVVADHNSYHIGELAIMRQTLNSWGESR